MCDDAYIYDEMEEEEEDGDELFSFIPDLPGPDEAFDGESEYGDLDDEDLDIDF